MTFTDRSEAAMTELLDKVGEKIDPQWNLYSTFGKYAVKSRLLPVVEACIDVLDAEPHRPKRDDDVAAWIKRMRNEHLPTVDHAPWETLDNLLDDYRLHADTGTRLDETAMDEGW